MPPERKTPTKFDADTYSKNKIKTLEDLFNAEEAMERKLYELKDKLLKASDETARKLIRKELEDAQDSNYRLFTEINKEAEASIEEQQEARTRARVKDFEEYKALLQKQQNAHLISEKKKNKAVKDLAKAMDREEQVRATRELARGKRERRAAREDLLSESKEVWGGVGGWKNSAAQMEASLSHALEHGLKQIGKAFADISNRINSAMDTYSKYQSSIDTRLQGTDKGFMSMQNDLKRAVGATPYLKTENMLTNLQTLVEAGIVANVEQRAFLNTIKDKVAATFDAANASLLRIIRLQQSDSTAARLGMEAYLTQFLNKMVENTEYLSSTFDSVQSALVEASSIMNTAASTEFEYIVQKWLGTLVGRGMSEQTATSLAGALGMLGSGNVTGLSGNALNNLLVMAASRAGLDYSSLLTGGMTAEKTNQLLESVVKYMQEIGSSSNNVVRSQYAQTFGLSVSDLVAAMGVGTQLSDVTNNYMSYGGMYDELAYQLEQVSSRTHISEKLANLFDNARFSLATEIAGNAVSAAMWKVTDLIQGVTGGINIPMISVMGNAVDLETTVENLMKLGLVGVGTLGMIGDVVTGLGNTGSGFSRVLDRLKISSGTTGYRTEYTGLGLNTRNTGLSTSTTSSLIVNSATEDIEEQTLNKAMDDTRTKREQVQQDTDNPSADIREYLLTIFDAKFNSLLNMTAHTGGYASAEGNGSDFIIGGRSMVKAEYSVKDDTKGMTDLLGNIATTANNIYDILNAGNISVTVTNAEDFRSIII